MLFGGFIGGVVRGFVGFGGALVIVLVASVVMGPASAVAIAALSGVPSTIQLLPSAIRHAEQRYAVPFSAAAFISAPLGTFVLVAADEDGMKVAISIFVLVAVALMWSGWRPRLGTSGGVSFAVGCGAGLVQGATGVGGPLAVTVALARGGAAERQRGNVIGTVTALALCAMLPMAWHGLFTAKVVVLSGCGVPAYLLGTTLGARWFRAGHQAYFRLAALCTLAVTGLFTLLVSVHGLMRA